MRFGALQYCLGKPATLWEVAQRIGLDGVELGFGEANDLTSELGRRAATKREAEAAGLAIPSLMLGTLNQGGWSSDDETVRAAATDLVGRAIEAAADLCAGVVLVPFFFDAAPSTDDQLARVVEGFRSVAPLAERAGVTLGYEGELPAAAVVDLLDQVRSPALGCYYDVGNALWLGHDPVAEIRLLAGRICQVHIKEFGTKLSDCLLGEGNVPLPECLDALTEVGFDGWCVLEVGTFRKAEENTGRQLAYLKQFVD